MDQKMIDLYGKYKDGLLGRRAFMKKLSVLAGGTTMAERLDAV